MRLTSQAVDAELVQSLLKSMDSVLGIDAAWSTKNPSGVALVAGGVGSWRLVSLSDSYGQFLGDASSSVEKPVGSNADIPKLLEVCKTKLGVPVDLVAVDMPLAISPIVGRRASDNAVSKAYGARHCGTHSPSTSSPGKLSDELTSSFHLAGYPLQTTAIQAPGLIEVYPHPALLELADAAMKLPYKVGKMTKHWPELTPQLRRAELFQCWTVIVELLEGQISGVSQALPPPSLSAMVRELKSYEDMLDAVVCAWVGICALEGRAKPFGDDDSAIWIPFSSA